MLTIKELPTSERPYEKLEMYGEKTLSNAELIAIILKTGTKDQTAIAIAQNILTMCQGQDLRYLQQIPLSELKRIKGIGRVKAIQIKAICEIAKRMSRPINLHTKIREPKDIANLLMEELRYEKKEYVKLVILNTKNIVQKIVDIAVGNISTSKIEIRQIFEETIKIGMNKFILVHNHPSGDTTPSLKDIELTQKILEASNIMNVQFLDHIIIGDGTYESIFSKINQKKRNM